MYTTPSPKHFVKLNAATNHGLKKLSKLRTHPALKQQYCGPHLHTRNNIWAQNLNRLAKVYIGKESMQYVFVPLCCRPRRRGQGTRLWEQPKLEPSLQWRRRRSWNVEEERLERFPQRASWAVFPKWRWGGRRGAYIVRRGEKGS